MSLARDFRLHLLADLPPDELAAQGFTPDEIRQAGDYCEERRRQAVTSQPPATAPLSDSPQRPDDESPL